MSPRGSIAVGAVGLFALAGCGSSSKSTSTAASPSSSVSNAAPATTAAPAGATPTLGLRATSLGQIVVTAKGMTVYTFDHDVPGSGKSACGADCSDEWPAVRVTGTPTATSGVSGTLGTIARSDGGNQVTLNGHPLYNFGGDKNPGDTNGNGVAGIWHVVPATGPAAAAGHPATSAPTAGGPAAGPAQTSAPHANPPPAQTSPPTQGPRPTPAPTSPPTSSKPPVTSPYGY